MRIGMAVAVAVLLCGATVYGAVNTGGMDYWKGNLPVKYIYSTYTVNGPDVDTGTMDYREGELFARYIYKTEQAETFDQWLSAYPGTEGSSGADDDCDADGWSDGAEFAYWDMTGEESDPINGASGGQAIPLAVGWNLIGISADVCFYAGDLPDASSRALIAADYPDTYEPAASINTLLTEMGIADKVQSITGWHPTGIDSKGPVLYQNVYGVDTLDYLAGGYGYWVKVSQPCTWKIAGKTRLKAVAEEKALACSKGWNLMSPLFAKVHYESDEPAGLVKFGSDDNGVVEESNICDYLKSLAYVGGSQNSNAVKAMVVYDEEFPHAHTYYSEIPPFLQTLKYSGPGKGMMIQMDPLLTQLEVRYPAE